ncbi:MAG TPA: DUF4160 domain-containing protein [Verrucomicrobiae bacterium]
MNPISNVVILLVAIFFTGFFFKIAVPASAPQWIHQFASRNYPSTTGQITHSEVTHAANSKGTIFYDVNIAYRYEVGGQTFEAARFRYTPLIRCANPAWTQNIVNAHSPTHFHAIYAEHEALIEIETGNIHEGYLPNTAHELVKQWRLLHLQELREDWNRARTQKPLLPIQPLK